MAGGRGRRRIAPGKVLVIELDVRKEVRLEVGDPVARLGLDDRVRVDSEHVAWTDQLYGVADRCAVDVEVDANRCALDRRARAGTERIDGVDPSAKSLTYPGEKGVGLEWVAHATRARLISCAGITCSRPARSGRAAISRVMRAKASASLSASPPTTASVRSSIRATANCSCVSATAAGAMADFPVTANDSGDRATAPFCAHDANATASRSKKPRNGGTAFAR